MFLKAYSGGKCDGSSKSLSQIMVLFKQGDFD